LPHIQPASDIPYICSSLTPYISSNRSHCSNVSGAVLHVINRRVGTSLAVMPSGLLSRMLSTVGTPAAKVMPYLRIQSKKRLWENRLAICSVSPVSRKGIRLSTWAEFQPNERYSSVRSSAVSPRHSSVDSPLSQ
jgi:hypothetical protein